MSFNYIRDTVDTWMWVRVKLPSDYLLNDTIKITAMSKEVGVSNTPFMQTSVIGYPYDTSFSRPETLHTPCSFAIDGVTFMFSNTCDRTDIDNLKDNYSYRLWIMEKWYHEGPMRLFPSIIDMSSWPNVIVPDIELPWIDKWDIVNVLPSQVKLGISIQGTPFIPKINMDFIVGIRGKLERSVM